MLKLKRTFGAKWQEVRSSLRTLRTSLWCWKDFNNFGFCLISPFSLSLCSPSITNIYDGQVHLRPQAGMDSSGHGWSSDSASPPGRFPGGRSSWSWTRWRGRAGRSWARPQSRRANPRSCPTHPPAWGEGGDKCDVGISERPHKGHSLPVPGLPAHLWMLF